MTNMMYIGLYVHNSYKISDKDTAICKTRLGLEEGTRSDRSPQESEIKKFARGGQIGEWKGKE